MYMLLLVYNELSPSPSASHHLHPHTHPHSQPYHFAWHASALAAAAAPASQAQASPQISALGFGPSLGPSPGPNLSWLQEASPAHERMPGTRRRLRDERRATRGKAARVTEGGAVAGAADRRSVAHISVVI